MTNFKLLSVTAILSAAIAPPVFAQQAVDEPGLQTFYQSLGVGSHEGLTASAMASARSGANASDPVKRISAKPLHYQSQDVTGPRQQAGARSAVKAVQQTAFAN
jgi:hypothetical protein